MIRPILAYTLITSIIGGFQMFDVPQILTNGQGNPDRTSMTLIMFLNNHLKSKNYGMAGALSVYLFIISAILCFIVYKMTNDNDPDGSKAAAKKSQRRKKEEIKHEIKIRKQFAEYSGAYCVDCYSVIYVSVLLLYSDYKCNPFSCGAAEGVFGIAGNPFPEKSKECGK